MASMQAELNGAKRVPKTNAKKCMQNRFPNSGPPLYDRVMPSTAMSLGGSAITLTLRVGTFPKSLGVSTKIHSSAST